MCAFEIKAGTKTVGDFVLINAMMIQLYQPLNFMGMVYREIKQAVIDIETHVLDPGAQARHRGCAGRATVARHERRDQIRECRVLPTNRARPILKGISFEVPAGKPSRWSVRQARASRPFRGCCIRFYDLSGGRISIDGQDIAHVTQSSLREAIGMVPQDTVLFNDTIRYNIRYGRWEANDAEVEEAARLAQIDGFIRMSPKGYETEVGERGLKLSGGEKQRVAIARTILKARRSWCWTRRPPRSTATPKRKSRMRWSASRRAAPRS